MHPTPKKRVLVFLVFIATLLSGCSEAVTKDSLARILMMGDSLFAWNRASGRSIADYMERSLREPVIDRSVVGARVRYALPISGSMGMNISKQFRYRDWDWVVLNGGGNDLWFGCGCVACDGKINRMVSASGEAGSIPGFLRRIRATGAQVIYVGYLRSPGVGSIIDHCRNEGDEFERRIQRMAEQDDGIHFVSLKDLVPHGDRSYHSFDMIHPSTKASAAIASRVTAVITAN